MKITKDGFIWKNVSEIAKDLWNTGTVALYEVREDDSESIVDSYEELLLLLEHGEVYMEVGRLSEHNAREFLEQRGFQTRNLWHTMDIEQDLDNSTKLDILHKALTNDATTEQIRFVINMLIEDV